MHPACCLDSPITGDKHSFELGVTFCVVFRPIASHKQKGRRKAITVYRLLRYHRCACEVAVRRVSGAWVDNMMMDVSVFIGKAALIDATGNYGAVVQLKNAGGLFVGQRVVSERSKVGPWGLRARAAARSSAAFLCEACFGDRMPTRQCRCGASAKKGRPFTTIFPPRLIRASWTLRPSKNSLTRSAMYPFAMPPRETCFPG